MTGVNKPDMPHLAALLSCRRGGLSGGWAPARPTGRPAVTAAKSAGGRSRRELPPFRCPVLPSQGLPWGEDPHQGSAAALWPTILRPSQRVPLSGFVEHT